MSEILKDMIEGFIHRFKNKPKQLDNSSFPAGSPMYFYCRHCGEKTDTLPESYTCQPRTICVACDTLEKAGGMSRAKELVR